MSQPGSAVIIPFPRRREESRDALAASTERLTVALASLSTALTNQSEATRNWRDALLALSARLQSGVAGCGPGLSPAA